jgi:hypothetical protein
MPACITKTCVPLAPHIEHVDPCIQVAFLAWDAELETNKLRQQHRRDGLVTPRDITFPRCFGVIVKPTASMSSITMRIILLLFAFLPCYLAVDSVHERLVHLATANKGNIPLDETTFELLTSSQRTWSASIQLTAMDNRFRCAPCK